MRPKRKRDIEEVDEEDIMENEEEEYMDEEDPEEGEEEDVDEDEAENTMTKQKQKTTKNIKFTNFITSEEDLSEYQNIPELPTKILEILKNEINEDESPTKLRYKDTEYVFKNFQIKKLDNIIALKLFGPVHSMDWSTFKGEGKQYVNLCPYENNEFHLSTKQYTGKGRMLIYSFNDDELTFEYSLHHEHGFINQAKWCKKDCETKKQIGLIGVAYSDGTLGIYMIPKDKNKTLKLGGFERMNNFEASCTSVEWTIDHVISGYSNGDIIIWKINKKFKIGNEMNEYLIPIRQFNSHSNSIISIANCNVSKDIFATCGHDNKLKFWNLKELNRGMMLLNTYSHSWTSDICWPKKSNSLFSASHDGILSQLSITSEYESSRSKTCLNDENPINTCSISSTNSCLAFGCFDGNVKLYSFRNLSCHRSQTSISKQQSVKILNLNLQDDILTLSTNSFKKDKKQIFDQQVWINKVQFNPSTHEKLKDWLLIGSNSGFVFLLKIQINQ